MELYLRYRNILPGMIVLHYPHLKGTDQQGDRNDLSTTYLSIGFS